jgi:dimethylhistidine N-methyltransferase
MKQYADQMGQCIGEGVMLVEYGSGSSLKTRILLDHLADPVAYAPVDISRAHLHRVAEQLAIDYPRIEVLPVAADFTQPFELPRPRRTPTHTAVYFPGSTIGNFLPEDATRILTRIADTCGTGGGLLIGIDLQKDSRTLEQAYNDSDGVTAEFNLNLLQRLQRELDSDIDTDNFDHVAVYNQCKGRVELYVRSNSDHTVSVAGEAISFRKDELVHTEYSHKYTVDGFARLAEQAGLALRRSWSDKREYFAVLHFCVD